MSVWAELTESVRKLLLMQHELDQLKDWVIDMARKIEDHNGRLIRVETIIDLARSRQITRD
jgi:hypothetical protein